mmetsp:Transcript_7165/g.8902  ORF Transcript_7165/g.8902 Transcript_7165/m.8902 type:complete len:135 (-) Transcript_7165:379-783(-)
MSVFLDHQLTWKVFHMGNNFSPPDFSGPSPYASLSINCAIADNNPRTFGKYTLKSFNSKIPITLHRKQFSMHTKVNGRGIDFADFEDMTSFRVDNGLANKTMQTMTPIFPITGEASDFLKPVARRSVSIISSPP